jgi:hypothetical protein
VDAAAGNPHFHAVESWEAAGAMLAFRPRVPKYIAGLPLQTLDIHVRDHKRRELPLGERSLEARYGRFVLTQSLETEAEARRLALDASCGRHPHEARIGGHEGRVYPPHP